MAEIDVQQKVFVPCARHSSQPVGMFCIDDGLLICATCLISTHRGKKCEEIPMAVQNIKNRLLEKVKVLEEKANELNDLTEQLKVIRSKLREDSDAKQQSVLQSMELLRQLIDKKEEEMAERLHTRGRDLKEKLQAQYQDRWTLQQDIKQLITTASAQVGPKPSTTLQQVRFLQKWGAAQKQIAEDELDEFNTSYVAQVPVTKPEHIALTFTVSNNGLPPMLEKELNRLTFEELEVNMKGNDKDVSTQLAEAEKLADDLEAQVAALEAELSQKEREIDQKTQQLADDQEEV